MKTFSALSLVTFASAALLSSAAHAQTSSTPYLLPYTISTYMGGGTAPSAGSPCQGQSIVANAADVSGDGCLFSSTSAILKNAYQYDLRVDSQGNIYFADATSSSNSTVRKINALTGVVTVFFGGSSKACSVATTTYGDGCPANDGLANVSGNYTINSSVPSLAVARNGDVYFAGGSNNVAHKVSAATGIVSLIAGYVSGGKGSGGYTGDGGPAANAAIGAAQGIAVASNGDVYIADSSNNVVRKITASTGFISTVVGNTGALAGYTGDGGPATGATLNQPYDVRIDDLGNLFVLEYGNKSVRVVYAAGSQVAGLIAAINPGTTAVPGNIYTIMGGHNLANATPSGNAKLGSPRKLTLDSRGNIYVGDSGIDQVLSMDGTTGFARAIAGIRSTATSVAGTGCATSSNAVLGDGCPGTQATLWTTGGNAKSTIGMDLDPMGNLFVLDDGNLRIRKVSTGQQFPSTPAGSTITQTLQVHFVSGDTPAAANPFLTSVASSGTQDFAITGTPTCTLNADTTTDCLVNVSFTPSVPGRDAAMLSVNTTLGNNASFALTGIGAAPALAVDPGTVAALTTSLKSPAAAAMDGAGNTFIADTANHRVVRISSSGIATVFAGTGASGYTGDNGLATAATLASPAGIGVAPDGTVYIADTGNNVVRRIDPVTLKVTTVAGGATTVCAAAFDAFGNGCPATQAKLSAPAGIAVDALGFVAIADTGNNILRQLTPNGYLFSLAGGASTVCTAGDVYGNGCPAAQTLFHKPTGLAYDAARNLFIADTGSNEVRELVAANGMLKALAGNGQAGAYGDTGTATGAQLNAPTGVAVDAGGNLYIADTGNHAIRLVNSTGNINSVVGTLSVQGSTLTTSAATTTLSSPGAIVSTGNGRLAVLDSGNNRLLAVTRNASAYNFGYVSPNSQSNGMQFQFTSTGSVAASLPTPLFATTGTPAAFSFVPTGSNGCNAGQSLASGSSCYMLARFTPAATGAFTANYTETVANAAPVTLTFSGTGANLVQTTSTNVLNVPNPPYGTNIDITTTITGASCSPTAVTCKPTGTVTYYVDGAVVGPPVTVVATSGSDVATAHGLLGGQNQGSHTVVAVYSGDSNYQGSTSTSLVVPVAGAVTTTALTLTPATLQQFQQLTLSVTITSPITAGVPTGTVTFYANGTSLGTTGVDPKTGTASLLDTTPATTMGLVAGSYTITATYSGDVNFATSTSAPQTLTVQPDPATITLQLATDPGTGVLVVSTTAAIGTAQGSTAQTNVIVNAANTVNDTFSFSCTGLPQYSSCTFQPYQLTFSPVTGAPTPQSTQVTFFTDVDPTFVASAQIRSNTVLATALGWPVVVFSLTTLLLFRKRLEGLRGVRALLFMIAIAGSMLSLSGCSSSTADKGQVYLTPTGVYNVQINVKGKSTPSQSIALTFTVAPGKAGQE